MMGLVWKNCRLVAVFGLFKGFGSLVFGRFFADHPVGFIVW
jgi:hypothetical protein